MTKRFGIQPGPRKETPAVMETTTGAYLFGGTKIAKFARGPSERTGGSPASAATSLSLASSGASPRFIQAVPPEAFAPGGVRTHTSLADIGKISGEFSGIYRPRRSSTPRVLPLNQVARLVKGQSQDFLDRPASGARADPDPNSAAVRTHAEAHPW